MAALLLEPNVRAPTLIDNAHDVARLVDQPSHTRRKSVMNPRRYSLIVAIIFAVIAVLQLARAVLAWPIAVTTPWGTRMIPLWLNWKG